MPAITPEREQANRDGILSAARELYEHHDLKEISLCDIAELTSLSRPSIYNYFATKEDIFLALLAEENANWTADICAIDPAKTKGRKALARALAHTLERRETMLRLMTSDLRDMENNSSMEALIALKKSFRSAIEALHACIGSCATGMDEKAIERFVWSFLPFSYGVYPYVRATSKQLEAMRAAGIDFPQRSIYEVALPGIESLLGVD